MSDAYKTFVMYANHRVGQSYPRCARGAKFYTGQYDLGNNPDGHYE